MPIVWKSIRRNLGSPVPTRALVFILLLIVLVGGCSKTEDSSPTDTSGLDDAAFRATGVVTSDSSGTITTTSGAKIVVPEGAVPPTMSGATGSMTFSIEKDASTTPTLPPQGERVTDVYRFGPEGFVFAQPVQVTIPVSGNPAAENVRLFRIDPTSGEPVPFGGVYDPATKTISAQTYEMSAWFGASGNWTSTYYGCVLVDNNSGEWVTICIDSFNLKYPEVDRDFGGATSLWCGQYCLYWASEGPWFLPQGTYWYCVSAGAAATSNLRHFYVDSLVIDKPWTSTEPQHSNLEIGVIGAPGTLGTIPGPCQCTPEYTNSVGTGDLQVTLTWHSPQGIDLDLWVTEPSGERCNYAHSVTATGGRLDRDNRCSDYENGRPENIFWDSAPTGEYVVEVDWFSICAGNPTSVSYTVRVVNRGSAKSYSGTITPDPRTLQVARFSVGSAKAEFGELEGVAAPDRDHPPKN